MINADLLRRLLPPVAYDPNAPQISAELDAEGKALDAAQIAADLILTESDPRSTYQLLADWERVLGLPDPCTGALPTIEQRRALVVAKIIMKGGQSRQFFIKLADTLGYPGATIDEYRQATCNDTCNDALYSADDRFVWMLSVPDSGGIYYANCNSGCDEPLAAWGDDPLECAINRFKPAHTVTKYAYI